MIHKSPEGISASSSKQVDCESNQLNHSSFFNLSKLNEASNRATQNQSTKSSNKGKNKDPSIATFNQTTFGTNMLTLGQLKTDGVSLKKDKTLLNNIFPRRPSTMIEKGLAKRIHEPEQQSEDTFLMIFHSSPNNCLRGQSDDNTQINVRSIHPKFIRQLNYRQNERYRKSRRKVQINIGTKIGELNSLQSKKKKQQKPYNRKQMHEIWHNGIKIIAEFKNDILHGDAQMFYPNGVKFIGKYEQGVRIHGTFDFNNGYLYTGGFLGDKFHGQGQLTLPNGKTFLGDWVENQIVGKVQIKYPVGDVYYGQVKNFKKHGKGYLFFKNGDKFVGQFQNGSITGRGQYFIDQQCIGKGHWKNGELVKPFTSEDEMSWNQGEVNRSCCSQYALEKQNNGRIMRKQIDEQDDIIMDGVDEQQVHIHVRSNPCLASFQQLQNRSNNQEEDKIDESSNAEKSKQQKSSDYQNTSQQDQIITLSNNDIPQIISNQQNGYRRNTRKRSTKKKSMGKQRPKEESRNKQNYQMNPILRNAKKTNPINGRQEILEISQQSEKPKERKPSLRQQRQQDKLPSIISDNENLLIEMCETQRYTSQNFQQKLEDEELNEIESLLRKNSAIQSQNSSDSMMRHTGKFKSISSTINSQYR